MSAPSEDFRPIEAPDKWVLKVGDGVVTQLQIDYAFGLTIWVTTETSLDVRIETPFTFSDAAGARTYDPNEWTGLAPLLALHQATVTSAEVDKTGRLTIDFAEDKRLTVEPHPQYESFKVTSSVVHLDQRFLLVGLPGGGVSRV